jgi:NAD(P)-dependent dehydrogenase (short-subunit alcohol dehydrogenase family)
MEKIAVVTGTSTGIGFETALALAREGYYTYATMRDTAKSQKIKELGQKENLKINVLKLDVDDESSVKTAIQKILDEKQRIDVLVNNAGWALWGCVEDVSVDEFKAQFDTNFFSIIRLIQEVGPTMRKQGSGTIVNVSSVVGRIGFPASPAYISSKFALEGLSESLRFELAPFGVNVVIIEPGVIKTNFMKNMKMAKKYGPESVYTDITDKVVSGVKMMCEMGTDPKEVADAIVKATKDENPLPRYIVGNDASMFLEAKKNKTDLEFENYLKKELYGE